MTACTNHGGKARRVVTAALVGVLSLGAAPMVALASPAATDQVTTLTNSGDSAFARGTVDLEGADVKSNSEGFYATAKKDATPLDVYASTVKPLGKAPIDVTDEEHFKQTIYVADADGNATSETVEKIVKPGKYVIAVTALDGQYANGTASVVLDVKAASLDNLDWFDASSEGTSDQKLTYTGSTLEVGFQSDNVAFTEGEDYTVRILKKGTDNVPDAVVAEVKDAGDYVAYVEGKGQYVGQTQEVKFNVSAFYMNLATVDVDDVIGSNTKPAHPTRVYYIDDDNSVAELDPSLVDLTFVSGATGPAAGSDLFDKVGGYNFSVSYDKLNTNIVKDYAGNKLVNKVAAAATYQYDGTAVQGSYFINKAKGEKFDLNKIAVYNGEEKLPASAYTVTVKADGMSDEHAKQQLGYNTADTYEVTVKVDPSKTGYEAGGSTTFTVTIVIDSIDADANVYVTRKSDGVTVTSVTKTYDGKPIVPADFVAQAFDSEDSLLADSGSKGGITLALYDSEGNKIDKAVNAGEYTLKVESAKYELTGTTEIPVTINKADLSVLKVGALSSWYGAEYLNEKDSGSYSWTDLDIRYDTKVAVTDNDDAKDDEEGWDIISWLPDNLNSFLSCERYDETKGEWVEVPTSKLGQDTGRHRITLKGNDDLAKNYIFANADNTTTVEFVVAYGERCVFNDVKPGDWYFDVVWKASREKIMNGYAHPGKNKIFGALDNITRADVACVLFNMAGGQMNESADWYSPIIGWKSFEDVDGTQYYGKAIAWAKKTGVVNGYTDGTFRPEESITREELAAMLANYAKVIDQKDVTPEDAEGTLADFGDGSEVSGWATDVVAWAVENGVMGNGGYIAPTDDITRAEVAAMAVNYAHPEFE